MIRWAGRELEGAKCDSTGRWVALTFLAQVAESQSRGGEEQVERELVSKVAVEWSVHLAQASEPP